MEDATTQDPVDERTVCLGPVVSRAGFMMGDHPGREWSDEHAMAWEGLLEVARRLRREAEALLERQHGLSVSMLGILGRLVSTPDHTLRLTDLADAMGLSLSRISRVINLLEERDLVDRHACPNDGRAVHIRLTPTGLDRAGAAQETTFQFVHREFADRLSDEEIQVLAAVFSRLLGSPAGPPRPIGADDTC